MAELARRQHPADCGCRRCLGFELGNELAKKHGSYASALRLAEDERTRELAEAIEATQPVAHPCDAGAIWRLALGYRRLELSKAALDDADEKTAQNPLAGYTDKAAWLGRLRDDHARWLRETGRIEAELGRTPASRAKLGLHLATARRAMTLADLHEAAALEVEVEVEVEEADDGE
jgi:hypothetical protein